MAALVVIAYKWIPYGAAIALVAAYLIGCKTYGWVWDKNQGWQHTTSWTNKRNPELLKILREVRKINRMLSEKHKL